MPEKRSTKEFDEMCTPTLNQRLDLSEYSDAPTSLHIIQNELE